MNPFFISSPSQQQQQQQTPPPHHPISTLQSSSSNQQPPHQQQQQQQPPLFGLIIPEQPLQLSYQRQSNTHFLMFFHRYPSKDHNCIVMKLPNSDPIPQGHGLGIYYATDMRGLSAEYDYQQQQQKASPNTAFSSTSPQFEYLGYITDQKPSVELQLPPWPLDGPPLPKNKPVQCCIGIAVETLDSIQNKQQRYMVSKVHWRNQVEAIVKATANSLHTYLTSFVQSAAGDRIVIPANAIDRWLEKIRKKITEDPQYLFKQKSEMS